MGYIIYEATRQKHKQLIPLELWYVDMEFAERGDILIPRTQMTLVLIENRLVLEG